MKSFHPLVLSLALMVFMSGFSCRSQNGDGGLTAEQQTAIDSVVAQLAASAKAVTSLADGLDSLDSISDVMVGECPIVTARLSDGEIAVTLEFPEGCTNDYYGNSPVSGSVSVAFNVVLRTFDANFEDFTTDDHTVDGTLALHLTRNDLGWVLTGAIDIATTDIGSAEGTLTVRFDVGGGAGDLTIAIIQADLTFIDENETSYGVVAEGLLLDPIENGNFIPEAGTVSFDVPGEPPGLDTVTLAVAFDTESPVDGKVQVAIGDRPPVEHQLPGFGDAE